MKVLIKDLKEVFKLPVYDRGIFITIVLTKDEDPKIWWLKFKSKIKKYDDDVKRSLVLLHDKKYIIFPSYKSVSKRIESVKEMPQIREVLSFMNNLYGRGFQETTVSYVNIIGSRLRDGETVDDLKLVIANRWEAWKDNEVMKDHLNPTTIFRPSKYAKYKEEVIRTKAGERFLSAQKMDLKNGDKITLKISSQLIDKEAYTVKRRTVVNGKETLIATTGKFYGKDIKLNLKRQDNKVKAGRPEEFTYEYVNE